MAGKPTIVTEEAIELAAILLGQRLPKYAIKAALKKKFRKAINPRSVETILSHARGRLAESANKTPEQLRLESLRTYESIIADPATRPMQRIKAQEALDKLMGLVIHVVKHTGTGAGGAIKTENATTLDLSKLGTEDLQALKAIRQKAAGTPGGA